MPRPVVELADIFRESGEAYRQSHRLPREHLRVMRAVEVCRTAVLGGHVEKCSRCDHQQISYNSCRNRHCPKCQNRERAHWLEQRRADLLPVEYFHVVFTVPEPIARIAAHNQQVVYGILFRAAAGTLIRIARDRKHLGAEIGFFAVLHTWGQNLLHHPHVHCVVPGGGLSPDHERWIGCRRGFFLPVRVLSRLFRRLFLEALQEAFDQGALQFPGELASLGDPLAFSASLQPLRRAEWVVYAKPPFGGPQQVIEYLGRYTHRTAISNERLLAADNGEVTFRWKDYRHQNQLKAMTISAPEFIRRFLGHVLPPGFRRIRHFGFMANCHRQEKLALCRRLLTHPISELLPQRESCRELLVLLPTESPRCPKCGIGEMIRVELLPPFRWPATPPDTS
jgi:hypothetical protein